MVNYPSSGKIFYAPIYDISKEKILVGIYRMVAGPTMYHPTVQKIELEYSNYWGWMLGVGRETVLYVEDLKFMANTLKQAKKNLIGKIFTGPSEV